MSREEPILFMGEKVRKVLRDYRQQFAKKQVYTVPHLPWRKADYSFHVANKSGVRDIKEEFMRRSQR